LRPGEDGEGFAVVELADVFHDHDRVDAERERERGA
jgi:hypothetical protein